ncbi:helix-turn-helix domain-containing protein [Prescottella agglutinans]|nr:helix-turn-helix transcriptional regulator [Prescottella agglutinans]
MNPPRTRGMCHNCYVRWHTRQTAFGRFESRYVEPELARKHVQLLQESMSMKAIAAAAGVSDSAVRALLVGKGAGTEPSTRLLRTVADSLLAVPVPPQGTVAPHIRDGQQVDGTGTRRRLRALIAAGHTQSELDTRLGWTVGSVNRIVNGRTRRVTAGRHRETAALFKELQLIPGTSARARARALRSRWPLPFQWDEETIDDPAARSIQCRSNRRAA